MKRIILGTGSSVYIKASVILISSKVSTIIVVYVSTVTRHHTYRAYYVMDR